MIFFLASMSCFSCGGRANRRYLDLCLAATPYNNHRYRLNLRNISALAVNCCIITHCLEVSCKEDQITRAQHEWFIFIQLTDKRWIITQQFTHLSRSILILTQNKRRKHITFEFFSSSNFLPFNWRNPANSWNVLHMFTWICNVFEA